MSKNPHRYEALAAWARARGYERLTGATIHSWLKRGLPLAAMDERPGFGQRITREREETYAALLAACRYRYDRRIRAIGVVGGLMWLDGWAVEPRLVREGLIGLASNPDRLIRLTQQRSDVDRSNLASLSEAAAVTFAYHPALATRYAAVQRGTVDRADLALGIGELLQLFEGAPVEPDQRGVRALGRLVEAEEEVDAGELQRIVASRLRPPVLIARIRRMSDRSLEAARERTIERLSEAQPMHPLAGMIVLLAEVAVGHLAPQRVK